MATAFAEEVVRIHEVASLSDAQIARAVGAAAHLFAAGIVLFSGSLYAYALTGTRAFAMITPAGGIAFLAGWAAFAWGAWRTLGR